MNHEEELLKRRQSVLDVGQRNQFEAVQTEIRRNNEALTSLRRENKELRSALQMSLRGQSNVSIEDHYAKEEDLMHNKMCVLKRSLNAVKGKNAELTKEIEKTREDNNFVQNEGAATAVDENSAVAKKIRALENRLDKCLTKHNEVNAIRCTYETLLERLQLEQAGFDTQLSSTDKALQSAKRELAELNDVGQQASKSRDQSRAEVSRLKAKLAEDRRTQAKDLEQRRQFIQDKRDVLERKHNTLVVKMAQQEERHAKAMQTLLGGNGTGGTTNSRRRLQDGNERGGNASWLATLTNEELEELRHQKEAYLKLRDATMSANVAEVIGKLRERRDNHEQLTKTAADLERAMQANHATKSRMQGVWEDMNQKAGGAMVTAKTTRTARDVKLLKRNQAAGGGGDSDDDFDENADGSAVEPDYGLLASRLRQNRAITAEFAGHLKDREGELDEAQKQQDVLSQLVTDVEAGVQHLGEKLSVLSPPGLSAPGLSTSASTLTATTSPQPGALTTFAALLKNSELGDAALLSASEVVDLLRSCDAKMRTMLDALSLEEIEAVARAMSTARVIVPETNTRLKLVSAQPANTHDEARGQSGGAAGGLTADGSSSSRNGVADGAKRGDDENENDDNDGAAARTATSGAPMDEFPDSEIHDRNELKMMSLATVEREETKRLRRRAAAAARKDETM